MSKIASYEPFGHLHHKLWQKEGSGIDLTRCVQMEFDTSLKSFQRELQVCFRPRPNRRYEKKIMNPQNLGSPNRNSLRTPPWESRDQKPFGCGCHGVTQRILYGGRWWLPSNLGRGESCESRVTCGSS